MHQLFRFIQRIEQAVSPTFNSLITVGDTVLTVFSKLQSLLGIRQCRTVLLSSYTGGASTTADQNIMSLTIPAAYNQVGNVITAVFHGSWTKPFSIGTTLAIWVKINGTKVINLPYTSGSAASELPISFDAIIVNRTVGSTGTFMVAGNLELSTNASNSSVLVDDIPVQITVDTTADVTIIVGYTFSNSNASNNLNVPIGTIIME